MNLHWFQHVTYEDLGHIATWATRRGCELSHTLWDESAQPPPLDEVDFLVVMGGPMGVGDASAYPWLEREIDYVRTFIATGKPILGICLGAQLMAAALGARVYQGLHPELGWHAVSSRGEPPAGWSFLPTEIQVFQWHGDTFDLPDSCVPLYGSPDVPNQAFWYGPRALALQFHLESTPESVRMLRQHSSDEVVHSRWANLEFCEAEQTRLFARIHDLLFKMLDQLVRH